MILLNPGPVTMVSYVRAAMAEQDVCHREVEFADLTVSIAERLEQVYGGDATSYRAVLLAGSGTAAVEAMLATYAPSDKSTLVIANGVYGERMTRMLELQRKPHEVDHTEWTTSLNTERIARTIRTGRFGAVAVVHHETTTGTLNDLDAIAASCAEVGAALLIDAVSSFGGEDVATERWRPLAVAGSANKCLHGAPGLSFVLINDSDKRARGSHAPVLYLDLEQYRDQRDCGESPFTLPTHVAFALNRALEVHASEGGWRTRREHYRTLTALVRESLVGFGFTPLVNATSAASMLTAFWLPTEVDYARLHNDLKRNGFIVYGGQHSLAGKVFRVATMGDLSESVMTDFINEVEEAVNAQRR
jgi:2-aminoethylphosphonate-pyruvate transaminase